jgi:hypothetical protein
MSGVSRVCGLALLGLVMAGLPARAEVFIRVPYVTLSAGRPARPGGPAVRVVVPPWVDVYVRPARPLARRIGPERAPAPLELSGTPEVTAPAAIDQRPVTLRAFANRFQPAAGFYEVLFIHPDTGRPVVAHFTLPDGEPQQVRLSRNQLYFDYGKSQVMIRFEPRGGVHVDYR